MHNNQKIIILQCQTKKVLSIKKVSTMEKEEKKELEQEYENLKLLISFHQAYGVPEDERERDRLIDDILDRMNEIKKRLENE